MLNKLIENSMFFEKYSKDHEFCPNCGEKSYKITFRGYFLNLIDQGTYKDLDECECPNCGDLHVCHDQISKEEAEILMQLKDDEPKRNHIENIKNAPGNQ